MNNFKSSKKTKSVIAGIILFMLSAMVQPSYGIIKHIIWDVGGVLVIVDPGRVYGEYFGHDPSKMRAFYQETGIYRVNTEEMDRGRPFQEALTALANRFPRYREPIFLWQTSWPDMVAGPIAGSVEILRKLRNRGYGLYALTNFATETFFPHIRYKYDFFDWFKDIVVSGIEKVVKPDPAIYRILLERNGLDPSECLFIDDNSKNIKAADRLGMETILFETPEQLLRDLKKLGVLIGEELPGYGDL